MSKNTKGNVGSSFEEFLHDEGIYKDVTHSAIKAVLARQIEAEMHNKGLTKSDLAKRMESSRSALDRLLDPENDSVTLATLIKAANAVGRQLRLELI